jgi:hypothetical protein
VLERGVREDAVELAPGGKLLGRFRGTPVPSDADLIEVRRRLWGAIARRGGHAA